MSLCIWSGADGWRFVQGSLVTKPPAPTHNKLEEIGVSQQYFKATLCVLFSRRRVVNGLVGQFAQQIKLRMQG